MTLRFRAAGLLWRHPPDMHGPDPAPLDIIQIHGLRFKIEVSFKDARPRGHPVRRKIAAYHRHIQLGLIAQGLLQILSATKPKLVWRFFGSWLRTVRSGLAPFEQVVAVALRNTLPEFLATAAKTFILVKFIRDRLDLSGAEGTGMVA